MKLKKQIRNLSIFFIPQCDRTKRKNKALVNVKRQVDMLAKMIKFVPHNLLKKTIKVYFDT